MNRSDLLASLLAATGDLKPTSGSTLAELDDLRRAFLQSFEQTPAGTAPAPHSAAAGTLTSELEYLVAQHLSAPRAGNPVRIVSRRSPVRIAIDPATPDWTVGLAPARTFGPFADRDGRLLWHDLFTF